uniref:A kinase-anchoring proteins AKAP-5 and AKAP-12 calmodulin (CaM)-binding domain-containing protein n=1 Tax=Monopterus albus TaxID=43700 RepID=A0A3Q3K6Q0_MONAL
MGTAQSAQREGKKDSTAEEESGKVDDSQTGKHVEHKVSSILSPDRDVTGAEGPIKEEVPLENVTVNEKESPNEEVPLVEMDAKQNDINESFRRFFSNIGLKMTVKMGSTERTSDVPVETHKEKPDRSEEDTTKETENENAEEKSDLKAEHKTYYDSACPTLTTVKSQDLVENVEENATETKHGVCSENVGGTTNLSLVEHEKAQQDATPEEEIVVSSIKSFFTTGIFSGLRKKKKPRENEATENELVDKRKTETVETAKTLEGQQQDEEGISQGAETEHKEDELKEDILTTASTQTTDEEQPPSTDPSTITVIESEILGSQEKDKVQASPLKRLLSGSSLKKLSKKQRGRKSSDAKLSDSVEHVSDQLLSSTESTENQKEESPAGEEDGAWVSFKNLVTPKKRMKSSSSSNEETQIPSSAQESKSSEGEQISDHSTEEGKRRKDSSVSWEAVLCGSRRRRSRKTSDSEDETPPVESDNNKQELPVQGSNEDDEILTCYPKQAGSPSDGDGGSTWKSFKKLVTPIRKVKDVDERHDIIKSDSEVIQDDSSFAMKKLLPGRKKRKSVEKRDQVSSDETYEEVTSGDEDTETPAVVPLSEFDSAETGVHIQTQVKDNKDPLENGTSTTPASNEEPEDLTELISKHQQLSDIPEEGVITETMVTPTSFTEMPLRDDTIAEDVVEITSEAITALEPVDISQTDESEMISAVSQLSESSKTSGNTTPVPAEYDIKDTEVLLQHVVEIISINPQADPVCSDEIHTERIAVSVSHQILETFVKGEATVLELHRRLEATAINTGLYVEEPDAVHELAATAQTASISEVKEAVYTETVSKGSTEQFHPADTAVDEVHEANIKHPEESIKELKSTNESHAQLRCLSEVTEATSTEMLPENVVDEGSLIEEHQAETETSQTDFQKAESAAKVEEETKNGAVEHKVQTMLTRKAEIIEIISDQVQADDQDQPPVVEEEWQAVTAVEAATLNSEEGPVRLAEKEVISEAIPAGEAATNEPKEEMESFIELNFDPEKENELQTHAAKTENVQVPEISEAVQETALEAEIGSMQVQEKKIAVSVDIPPAETVTDEPKQTAEQPTEVCIEPVNNEPAVDAPITDHHQVTKVLKAALDLKEGSVQPLKKQPKTVKEGPKVETEPLSEVTFEPVDASKTEPEVLQDVQVMKQDSEQCSVVSFEKEVKLEEMITFHPSISGEPTQAAEGSAEPEEEPPVEDTKTEHVQEPDVLPCDVKDTMPEKEILEGASTSLSGHVVTQSMEEGSTQEPEKQVQLEDAPKPKTNDAIASVTAKTEIEALAEVKQGLEINEDKETEGIPQDVLIGQDDRGPEVVDKLQTLSAAHIPFSNVEASSAHDSEKRVTSEETPASCADNASVTHEPKHEVQVTVEGENQGELPGADIITAVTQHAIAAQVITCDLKDVSAVTPDVMIKKTSEMEEPLRETTANEVEFKQEAETATPLVKHNVTETAKEASVVVMMHVASVELEDSHRIQVQVVDADVKSAEMIVDSVLEAEVTEVKEVIDVCHETVKAVDSLFTTKKIEGRLIEETKANIQEVIYHVKEKLSLEDQSRFQDQIVNLEQEVINQDGVTEVTEMVGSELNEVENQNLIEDTTIHDCKDDLEEPKAELAKCEAGVTAEEAKLSSEELDVKKIHEKAQTSQICLSQIVTPSSAGLLVPQNTGIISSICNLEFPSSLLESKLNIQFGQTMAPSSPPPTTERAEQVKETDVSEVNVQAVAEREKSLNATQRPESQKQTALPEVSVQATEGTQPEIAKLDSAQRAAIMTQPVVLDTSIQAMETMESGQETKSTERVAPNVQGTEPAQLVKQTKKREVFVCQPLLSDKETKAKESVKQKENENDSDVWTDAEEDFYTKEEAGVSLVRVEALLEHQTEEVKAGPDHKFKMAPTSKTREEETQQEMYKTGVTCETEDEGEDFSVALEHPESATRSITTVE